MISLVLFVLAAAACGGAKAPQGPREISAAKLERGTIERRVLFTGNIVAQDAFDIYPRAAGKVSQKLLKEGDEVKRNQPILLVERDEVGYTFKPLPVVSLADGLVGTIAVDVGSYVEPSRPVATVVRPGNMRVKLDVPERYLGVILPGTDVSMAVDSLNGDTYRGTIVTSSPVVDERTRTAKVEVEVPNTDGRLRHGMFGRLNLVVEQRPDTLSLPLDAISWEGEKQFVYRLKGNKLERREVKPGLRNDTHVEILEGLTEGDRVAVGDLLDLKDGEPVKIAPVKNQESRVTE